ncbi:MAG TPA: hypothetical protein VGC32_13235 [Solirubrobacterales bacterium]
MSITLKVAVFDLPGAIDFSFRVRALGLTATPFAFPSVKATFVAVPVPPFAIVTFTFFQAFRRRVGAGAETLRLAARLTLGPGLTGGGGGGGAAGAGAGAVAGGGGAAAIWIGAEIMSRMLEPPFPNEKASAQLNGCPARADAASVLRVVVEPETLTAADALDSP